MKGWIVGWLWLSEELGLSEELELSEELRELGEEARIRVELGAVRAIGRMMAWGMMVGMVWGLVGGRTTAPGGLANRGFPVRCGRTFGGQVIPI